MKLDANKWFNYYNINNTTYNIVVTKTVLKKIHIENLEDALGTYLKVFGSLGGIIVGVVENFHTHSLQEEIQPVNFLPYESLFAEFQIKTLNKPCSDISSYIEESWNEVFPEYIYTYQILEESINKRYGTDQRFADIILIFTFIAIVIACLGFYGLVQRTKEIGIRKALGTSVPSLVMMVSWQFLKLVLVSYLFAWPIAYYLMKN